MVGGRCTDAVLHPPTRSALHLVFLVFVLTDSFPAAWRVRLLHLCDAVLALEAISDASSVYKLLPDSARLVICG